MAGMSPSLSSALLATFRRHARAGTWLFVLLLLVVAAERRLAEAHFNLRSSALGLESQDVLDADEIRVRLIVLNDDHPPVLPAVSATLATEVVSVVSPRPDCIALGGPAPRGPPPVGVRASL
jgi:hypothetical protein